MRLFLLGLVAFFSTLGAMAFDRPIPAGWELQVMEPTGGKILKPKDWFYEASGAPNGYRWIVTKENPKLTGRYETGTSIQLLEEVSKSNSRSAEAFAKGFVNYKGHNADKVLNMFPEVSQVNGLFSRIGIETIEGKYHILYSVYWSKCDLVVVVTMGSPVEEWSKYENIFHTMGEFELIDMSRFTKDKKAATLQK